MYLQTESPLQKEELIVFKYKRDRFSDGDQDTLVFSSKSKKMMTKNDSIQNLSNKMSKMSLDQSIFCLKKIQQQIQPAVQRLIFRTRDLQYERRAQIRNDLIKGLRSKNFPSTIKVCEIEDEWIPYKPSLTKKEKQKVMEEEPQHDYYILARDVLDQQKQYHQIQKPVGIAEYIGESEGELSDEEIDSEDSNREDNPDNDYPEEDYDFDEEDDQEHYGEYNPYDDNDDDY